MIRWAKWDTGMVRITYVGVHVCVCLCVCVCVCTFCSHTPQVLTMVFPIIVVCRSLVTDVTVIVRRVRDLGVGQNMS